MVERTDTSVRLLRRYRDGDEAALAELLERHIEPMRRWARGRLPRWARDTMNTDDIVQDVLVRTVARMETFEPQHDDALQSYLRQAILNRIRDEVRRSHREPARAEIDSNAASKAPSAQEEAEARELFQTYETALERLSEEDREAVVLRVDFEVPYREIARIMGKPTEEAAQMSVGRALVRLAREMGRKK